MSSLNTSELSQFKKKAVSGLGFLGVLLILIVGIIRTFTRGANDFSVFYEAWRLVITGHGLDIYRASPDRFLYSPGFAWILSPLALFSKSISLGIWCLLKVGFVFLMLYKFARIQLVGSFRIGKYSLYHASIVAWAVILISRPLLIDLEYGQVNFLILAACIWGLLRHFDSKPNRLKDFSSWVLLSFAAVAKLYPIPLLLLPVLSIFGAYRSSSDSEHPKALQSESESESESQAGNLPKYRYECLGILVGTLGTLFAPMLQFGWSGLSMLLIDWREALISRGLPMESHNQSFVALLNHYLSGNPTWVRSEGMNPLLFGIQWLSSDQIALISLFWTFLSLGILVGWIISGPQRNCSLKWSAILIGLLIIPSHLVWKPYFVMSLPMAIILIQSVFHSIENARQDWKSLLSLAIIFFGMNLTGFDFVGHRLGAYLEAASSLLFVHLFMMVLVARKPADEILF